MTAKARALGSLAVVLSTMWLAGCGHYVCGTTFGNATCSSSGTGTGGNTGVTSFVYFMDDSAQQMAAEGLNVSSSGKFVPLNFVTPTFPTNVTGQGGSLGTLDCGVLVVNKTYLYIPFENNNVYGFTINTSTGALTEMTGSPFAVSVACTAAAADPAGKYLFVGGTGGISVMTISATDGTLAEMAGSPFDTTIVSPMQVVTDGMGKYLYSVDGTAITQFSYGTTGLTSLGTALTSNMAMLASEPTGKYMVGVTAIYGQASTTPDTHVYEFTIAQSGSSTPGTLTQTATPTASTYSPVYVAVTPNGSFVYTFSLTESGGVLSDDPIEGFALNASTGALTELSGLSPFTTLKGQMGKFDQSGDYLFEIGLESTTSTSGMIPLGVNGSTGAIGSTLGYAGAVSTSYAVTDAP